MSDNGDFTRKCDLLDLYQPEVDAAVRGGFEDNSAYSILRTYFWKFAVDLVVTPNGWAEPSNVPFDDMFRQRNPHIGSAIGAVLVSGIPGEQDCTWTMCEQYAQVALHANSLPGSPIADIVIASGRSRSLRLLDLAMAAATDDARALDRRVVSAWRALRPKNQVLLWASRACSWHDGDDDRAGQRLRVFKPHERLLLAGECLDAHVDPTNSCQQAMWRAKEAFWNAYGGRS